MLHMIKNQCDFPGKVSWLKQTGKVTIFNRMSVYKQKDEHGCAG